MAALSEVLFRSLPRPPKSTVEQQRFSPIPGPPGCGPRTPTYEARKANGFREKVGYRKVAKSWQLVPTLENLQELPKSDERWTDVGQGQGGFAPRGAIAGHPP